MAVKEIYQAVLEFDESRVAELTRQELGQGVEPAVVLNDGLIAAMDEVGRLFGEGELYLPEMLVAAQAMKAGVEVLRPLLTGVEAPKKGCVVIGTVKGDLHDIGKNLVAMMLEGAGFEVVDLGVDVSTEKFVAAVSDKKADVVALSSLLTTTMTSMKSTVAALREKSGQVRIVVGGAPVTASYAKEIGADGYSADAAGAVHMVRKLLAA